MNLFSFWLNSLESKWCSEGVERRSNQRQRSDSENTGENR
uniref:Uncharacterized protein n=1 Tax=Anguilla anguilla TaxID=7936 RepID=A0A0E9QL07_ANGAN